MLTPPLRRFTAAHCSHCFAGGSGSGSSLAGGAGGSITDIGAITSKASCMASALDKEG